MSEKRNLVYGIPDDNLILLPEGVAMAMAGDLENIAVLKTYGEARRLETQLLMVPGLDVDDEIPADGDPYDYSATIEVQDGSWPPRVATVALDHLPDDLDDIGEEKEDLISSPILYINPAVEWELVQTLQLRAYEVRRDDDLIRGLDPYA